MVTSRRHLHRDSLSAPGARARRRTQLGGQAGTPNVDCPRCGSDIVVPASSGGPTGYVLQLRSETSSAARETFDEWLCRACGNRWPHLRPVKAEVDDGAASGNGAKSDGDATPPLPGDLVELLDLPEASRSFGFGSRLVSSRLRSAREARGLTLSDVAKATFIRERYLKALESDASVEEFSPAVARSFLKAYAEFLGLEPALLVREFDARHVGGEEPVLTPLPDPRPRHRLFAIALVVASLLAVAAITLLPALSDDEREPMTLPQVASERQTPEQDAVKPPPSPELRSVRAVLVATDRCWVEAIGDGVVLEQRTLEPGDRVVYRADRVLQLALGSAGAVELRVGGELVDAGDLGEVVRFEFLLRDGEIVSKVA